MYKRFADAKGKQELRHLLSQQKLLLGCDTVVRRLAPEVDVCEVPERTYIYTQGDTNGRLLYLMLGGAVDLIRSGRLIATLGPREFFGEFPLLDPAGKYTVSVLTKERSLVAKVPWPHLASLADSCPKVWRNLADELAKRLRAVPNLDVPSAAPHLGPPASTLDRARVFVIMPYSRSWSDRTEAAISGACKDAGLSAEVAKYSQSRLFIQDIWLGVTGSCAVIADISGANPNVLYEVGLADAIGREVILLSQHVETPADLHGSRLLLYKNTASGAQILRGELLDRLRRLRAMLRKR